MVHTLAESPRMAKIARPKVCTEGLIDEILVKPVAHGIGWYTWRCTGCLLLSAHKVQSARNNLHGIISNTTHDEAYIFLSE
jgi:hypothetical protein